LYPRKHVTAIPDLPIKPSFGLDERPPDWFSLADSNQESGQPASTQNVISPSTRRLRKRTSDDHEIDQFGAFVSNHAGNSTKSADDKSFARKHRSLNVNTAQGGLITRDPKAKDRRRESAGLSLSTSMKSPPKAQERHVRQSSGSSANNQESPHQRRVNTTDFSHLPPSPSSSSIQPFLRHPVSAGSSHSPLVRSKSKDNLYSSPNVAHSLLRGTGEGWLELDNEATAAALRKLDGLHGKIPRARASVGSLVRPASSSRPGTPAGKSTSQWEGIGANESGKARRTNSVLRDNPAAVKEAEPSQNVGLGFGIMDLPREKVDLGGTAVSSDELSGGAMDKTPKKGHATSARSSLTNKRGSTSSTTYTSTPSSRDSASMSAATSMTSVSAISGRQSTSKARRNSASSDVSSIQSSDATSLKDRVASIAISGDPAEDAVVPPVPPLPKDLSTFRSPPQTSVGPTFSTAPRPEGKEKGSSHDNVIEKPPSSLEVPSVTNPPTAHSPHSQGHRLSQYFSSNYASTTSAPDSTPVVLKTPSKKWSFSSALSLKITSSPSSSSQKSSFALSPRAVSFGQPLRKSTSKDRGASTSAIAPSKNWEMKQPDAMLSAGSLTSLSSVGSVRTPAMTSAPSKTPERSNALSRTGTGSSNDTHVMTSGLSAPQPGTESSVRRGQSKRLTPSSIPFFRRSSSQSMQILPNSVTTSVSPPRSSGNRASTHVPRKAVTPPRDAYDPSSTTVSGSTQKKSSGLLGLPSLLKSSSRRSLHSESKEAAKELQRIKDAEKERGRLEKAEKERQKKEEKDRSESRISVLIGRKRGKVYMFSTIS